MIQSGNVRGRHILVASIFTKASPLGFTPGLVGKVLCWHNVFQVKHLSSNGYAAHRPQRLSTTVNDYHDYLFRNPKSKMLDQLDDIGIIGGQEAQDRLISFGFWHIPGPKMFTLRLSNRFIHFFTLTLHFKFQFQKNIHRATQYKKI